MGLWIIAGLSLIGTLLFGFLAGYGFWISHHMATEGSAATAVVTEVDGDAVTLAFTVEGQRVSSELTWMPFDAPIVNDEVQITYDPDDLTYVVPTGSHEDQALAIGFLVVACVGLLVSLGTAIGAIFIHCARSRNTRAAWPGPSIS